MAQTGGRPSWAGLAQGLPMPADPSQRELWRRWNRQLEARRQQKQRRQGVTGRAGAAAVTASQDADSAAAALSRQELAASGGWGAGNSTPMQGVAADSGNGKRKFDQMDEASHENSPEQAISQRGRTIFGRLSSLLGNFSRPFRWTTTRVSAQEENSSSTFAIPVAHHSEAAFSPYGIQGLPGQQCLRPLDEPPVRRMAAGDPPVPSGAAGGASARAFGACGTSREALGAGQGQARWSVQQSITEVMDAVADTLSGIGRTALFGFAGARHRGEGPLDPLDDIRGLSGFSDGFQRPFMENPQYMSLTMSGLGQAPMSRAGFRPGPGPMAPPPPPADVAAARGSLQECLCCGTAATRHQKDKQTLWATSQQIHGAPQFWPYVHQGCKHSIGADPRAAQLNTASNLQDCTLQPGAKRRKLMVTTTVKPGDSLWAISRQLTGQGANWKDLVKANPQYFKGTTPRDGNSIDNSRFVIHPGWTLKMPITAPAK